MVRQGKFGKSRELVLHPSTVTALRDYAALRDRTRPWTWTPAWFVSSSGSRLNYKNVHHRFHRAHPDRRPRAPLGDVPPTHT